MSSLPPAEFPNIRMNNPETGEEVYIPLELYRSTWYNLGWRSEDDPHYPSVVDVESYDLGGIPEATEVFEADFRAMPSETNTWSLDLRSIDPSIAEVRVYLPVGGEATITGAPANYRTDLKVKKVTPAGSLSVADGVEGVTKTSVNVAQWKSEF